MTSLPPLATSSTRSIKINVFTSPRIQEFVEESQQQKLLVGLLVRDRQVYPDIDGGYGCLLKINYFVVLSQIRSLIMPMKCYFVSSWLHTTNLQQNHQGLSVVLKISIPKLLYTWSLTLFRWSSFISNRWL
jgi:hypothetical protein